jgi:II/X family phage/plasmid replication protein
MTKIFGNGCWVRRIRNQIAFNLGSDKRISIKSTVGDGQGNATHLWISGNPLKPLQGHNVFGSDDAVSLVLSIRQINAID